MICQVLMEPDQWVADPGQAGDAVTALRPRRHKPVQQQKAKRQQRLQFQDRSPRTYRDTREAIRSTALAEAASPADVEGASAAADVEEGDSGKRSGID